MKTGEVCSKALIMSLGWSFNDRFNQMYQSSGEYRLVFFKGLERLVWSPKLGEGKKVDPSTTGTIVAIVDLGKRCSANYSA